MSLALLGADRLLSISEVLATVRPLASYIAARNWRCHAADSTNRSIRWTLHQMAASGVGECLTTRAPRRCGTARTSNRGGVLPQHRDPYPGRSGRRRVGAAGTQSHNKRLGFPA